MDEPKDPVSDARFEAISRGVDDVRDEMHASLDDVRRLVEQSREAVFRMESVLATSDPGASLRVAELVDGVRAIAERTRRRQAWLVGIVAVQAVLLAIAIGLIVLMRGDVQRGPVISSDVTVEHAQTLSSAVVEHAQTPGHVAVEHAQTLSNVAELSRMATEPQSTSQHPQSQHDDTKHRRRRHR